MILFFRRKVKDDLSQKTKYMEIWHFLQMFWKDSLSKKIAQEYDLSGIIWKAGTCSPETMSFFSFFGNLDELSREIYGNMAFFVYMYKFYKYDITLLPKKNQRWSPHEKIHLQVIEILDGHSRKCSNDSLFSMEIVLAFSCIVFQRKKNEEI